MFCFAKAQWLRYWKLNDSWKENFVFAYPPLFLRPLAQISETAPRKSQMHCSIQKAILIEMLEVKHMKEHKTQPTYAPRQMECSPFVYS